MPWSMLAWPGCSCSSPSSAYVKAARWSKKSSSGSAAAINMSLRRGDSSPAYLLPTPGSPEGFPSGKGFRGMCRRHTYTSCLLRHELVRHSAIDHDLVCLTRLKIGAQTNPGLHYRQVAGAGHVLCSHYRVVHSDCYGGVESTSNNSPGQARRDDHLYCTGNDSRIRTSTASMGARAIPSRSRARNVLVTLSFTMIR